MKESGSAKLDAECDAPQELTQTDVFSGTAWPSISEPPLGTVRRRPIGTGGKIRRPSSMQAFMYGRLPRTSILISASVLHAPLSSSFSFLNVSGFLKR